MGYALTLTLKPGQTRLINTHNEHWAAGVEDGPEIGLAGDSVNIYLHQMVAKSRID